MNTRIVEGLILKSIPFREHNQIITLFTGELGLIKLMYKGKKRSRPCMPLMQVEVIYQDKDIELLPTEEINILNTYPQLRSDLVYLQAACDCLQALLKSQMLGKTATPLYHLLIYYLERIPRVDDAWALATSFRLKSLLYEGVLTFTSAHVSFDNQEQEWLHLLSFARRFEELIHLKLNPSFCVKVGYLFNELLHLS
jgi:DNA repair protein RecO